MGDPFLQKDKKSLFIYYKINVVKFEKKKKVFIIKKTQTINELSL